MRRMVRSTDLSSLAAARGRHGLQRGGYSNVERHHAFDEVADFLGIDPADLAAALAAGHIDYVPIRGYPYVRFSDVIDAIEAAREGLSQ
ncbi:hypothetical protein WV31_12650 [Magnetospirillum sp. ME-1]|nr:hypothetical protein WV31_12650 [Magnetospirillum sp. ME-1]